MAVTLYHVGRTPGETQFQLAQFTEHYKSDSPSDVVLTDAGTPQIGDAHPSFAFMFVTARHCDETGDKASTLDVIYTGCLTDDGAESPSPILPASQQKYSQAIQTASSQIPIAGLPSASPLTLQFYAQTSELSFYTYNAVGSLGTAPDPLDLPIIIALQCLDANFAPGVLGVNWLISLFFQLRQTDTITPTEVVPGKFWHNTEIKTVMYGAPIFQVQLFSGTYFSLFDSGKDYVATDALTLTSGSDTASITVGTVDSRGAITAFTVTANTINPGATPVIIAATGGTGTGAEFSLIHP